VCRERLAELVQRPREGARGGGAGGTGRTAEETLPARCARAAEALEQGLVERDTQVRLLLLGALCRENTLFVGPPGTAKSELGRRLSWVLQGRFFQLLLTKFSVPEEVFGPFSLKALENDCYERRTAGYLPEVEVAFVDEIFKANSAILNSLLTVLNEREFDNGGRRGPVPLVSLVAASNEIPQGAELRALYDRFLLRCEVDSVSPEGLEELLSRNFAADAGACSDTMCFLPEDTLEVSERALAEVELPPGILQLICDLRQHLAEKCEPPVEVSDRRMIKAAHLLRVSALTNGRTAVNESDCMLLQHILWDRPAERQLVFDWLLGHFPAGTLDPKQLRFLVQGLFGRICKACASGGSGAEALTAETEPLLEILVDECRKFSELAGHLDGSFGSNIWMGAEESRAFASAVEPKVENARAAVEDLALDVLKLQRALELQLEPHRLAEVLPDYWGSFIRDGVLDDVKPLGVREGT